MSNLERRAEDVEKLNSSLQVRRQLSPPELEVL